MNTTELRDKFSEAYDASPTFAFKDLPNKRSQRQDLHAFLLLDEILPPEIHHMGYGHDMVSRSEHDEIWLRVDVEKLAEVITDDQIRELVACGVYPCGDTDSLHMFT